MVTSAAAVIAAKVNDDSGIQRAVIAQTTTVATDPQVPGPGFRRPTPKKVATSVAQSGAGPRDLFELGVSSDAGIVAIERLKS